MLRILSADEVSRLPANALPFTDRSGMLLTERQLGVWVSR
jgi:hypothetical protein